MNLVRRLARATADAGAVAAARRPLKTVDVCTGASNGPIVSLTSFPARIESAHFTIRSILRGDARPSVIELVLSWEEFPDKRIPKGLLALESRGLRVRFVPGNDRSYKKLVPTMRTHADHVIITADDDTIYPRSWLRDLLATHTSDREAIVGHRGNVILGSRNSLQPYVSWPHATPTSRSERVLLTGVSGILYPPRSLQAPALDVELARRLCPTGDDLWFKAMALLSGTRVRALPFAEFPTVRSAQRTSLRQVNVNSRQNESQFIAVMDYFDLWSALD